MNNFRHHNILFSIRLAVLICFITCILLFILSHFIERAFEKYSIEQNVNELTAVINSVKSELYVQAPSPENSIELEQNLSLIMAGHHHLYVLIQDSNGYPIYKTRGPKLSQIMEQPEFPVLINDNKTAIWTYHNQSYRIAASQLTISPQHSYTILVAVERNTQILYIQRLHESLRTLIIITCIITFIWTVATIYLTQKPINRLIKQIHSINSQQLSYRIPLSTVPVKFAGIIEAFNDLLARIEDVFQRQRNFTADIAHEIRTPITNLQTQTQIALNSARTTDEYREILYSNLEEYERLAKMVSDMLFLAQADNKQLIPELVPIDLNLMIQSLFDYYEALAEENQVQLTLVGKVLPIQGDRLMLSRAMGNLLSNALRYTPAGEQISVQLKQIGYHHVEITVTNPGKQIDARHLEKIFDRFYRIDKSRQRNGEGAGIGLAIVKSIITAHQGTIRAESDAESTRFIIQLPMTRNQSGA